MEMFTQKFIQKPVVGHGHEEFKTAVKLFVVLNLAHALVDGNDVETTAKAVGDLCVEYVNDALEDLVRALRFAWEDHVDAN